MIGDGTVTTLNGAPVRCRQTTQVEEATLLRAILQPGKYQKAPLRTLAKRTRLVRTWGDCYGTCCSPAAGPISASIPS